MVPNESSWNFVSKKCPLVSVGLPTPPQKNVGNDFSVAKMVKLDRSSRGKWHNMTHISNKNISYFFTLLRKEKLTFCTKKEKKKKKLISFTILCKKMVQEYSIVIFIRISVTVTRFLVTVTIICGWKLPYSIGVPLLTRIW